MKDDTTKEIVIHGYNSDEVEIIRSQIAPGCTVQELKHFGKVCQMKKLDPFSKQIYALKRKSWDADSGSYVEKMSIQTSIDGYRVIAVRTGLYEGQVGPFWCGDDGKWVDVWLSKTPPTASKVGALRKGCKEPFWCVAVYTSYVQTKRDGKPISMWAKMPDLMLAKCAESLALRKAFPEDLSGIYTDDEMASTENDPEAMQQVSAMNRAIEAIEDKMGVLPKTEVAVEAEQNHPVLNHDPNFFDQGDEVFVVGPSELLHLKTLREKTEITREQIKFRTLELEPLTGGDPRKLTQKKNYDLICSELEKESLVVYEGGL